MRYVSSFIAPYNIISYFIAIVKYRLKYKILYLYSLTLLWTIRDIKTLIVGLIHAYRTATIKLVRPRFAFITPFSALWIFSNICFSKNFIVFCLTWYIYYIIGLLKCQVFNLIHFKIIFVTVCRMRTVVLFPIILNLWFMP